MVDTKPSEEIYTFKPNTFPLHQQFYNDIHTFMIIIGERSEPLSRVFNDQPRDIYIYMAMSNRTYVSNTHAHVHMSD